MNSFWGFVLKEANHILRDVRTLIILIGMPVAQVLLFGFVITNELKDARIAIWDQANDDQSAALIGKISSSGYFHFSGFIEKSADMEAVFQAGQAKAVLVIAPGFGRTLIQDGRADVQVITDASEPNNANLLLQYIQAIVNSFVMEKSPGAKPPFQVKAQIRMLFNPELKGAFMFVPGTMAMLLILISAMMTSISIAREKELGTMEVLLVSPLRPFQIIGGKVIPYVVLSFVISLIIIGLGVFVFGVPVKGSLLLLLMVNMLFIILSLSLGIFISVVSQTQQVAMMISMFALMLPTMLLSGFIYPIENMPKVLQWFSVLMPPRWFLVIIKNIMLKGVGIGFIWKELLILLGMTGLFLGLGVFRFKERLS